MWGNVPRHLSAPFPYSLEASRAFLTGEGCRRLSKLTLSPDSIETLPLWHKIQAVLRTQTTRRSKQAGMLLRDSHQRHFKGPGDHLAHSKRQFIA